MNAKKLKNFRKLRKSFFPLHFFWRHSTLTFIHPKIKARNYFKLSAILREVHYLKLMDNEGIPEVALKMSERNEVFRKYITNLNCTIEWYNKIRRNSRDVEFQLIENEIEDIDKLIAQGQNLLNWNSEGFYCTYPLLFERILKFINPLDLWEYMVKLHDLVGNLQQHLQKSQDNLLEIKHVLIPFARQPLFERKDGKKNTVLCIEEREERINKRYNDITNATDRIIVLLNQNMELFEMTDKQDDPKWINYIEYVDKIALSYLYQTVGCR